MSPKKSTTTETPKLKASPAPKGARLPILWEFINTIARIVTLITGLTVIVLSYLAGCGVLWIVIRAGAAMLAVGLIFWLLYWFVARGSLITMSRLLARRQNELGKGSAPGSMMEFKA